ncbi:Platelet glycoprotein 4 like protein [Argiope bruennichi]|uniref:Platelet glycoprotein 4 like protein n=1 Tax=Argiope bruennichi TaxID=94029 RepID=A0A8T0E452_ARGBR|nr:Platelet glycoprotein 4 like protein [Argiope bruennichi]
MVENRPTRPQSRPTLWKDRPLLMYRRVKVFNITNPGDFLLGSKMIVKEVGPVTYEMEWRKSKFFWQDGGILAYRRETILKFNPELNWIDENEVFYTLNSTLIHNADRSDLTDFDKMKEKQLIIKTTIKQYMQETVDKSLKSPLLREVCPKEEFIMFYRGEESIENLNFLQGSYGRASPDNEKSNAAIRNSLDIGPPMNEKEVRFKYLEPNLCQCMIFIQADTVEVNGVKNIRFEVAPIVNGFNDLDRSEFFQESCKILSDSRCCPTFPVVLSLPHFYSSSEAPNSLVSGLHPNESIHNSFIIVEPMTGLTTSFVMRYQFNVKLEFNKNWEHVRKDYCQSESLSSNEEQESFIEITNSRDYHSINEPELPEKESPPLLKAFPGYSRCADI